MSVNLMSMFICVMADSSTICKTCHIKVQSFSKHVLCKNFNYKHHATCVRLDRESYNISPTWYCPHCVQTILPFNHFDEDEDFFGAVMEQRLNCSFRFHEMNGRVFVPFEINQDSNTPFSEIDTDLQFYTESNYIQNTNCDYYLEDSFNDCFSECKTEEIGASFCHSNIKSLPKHYNELNLYLDSLLVKFSFIALTETWLSESTEELYGIQNYYVVNRFQNGRKGGCVTLYMNGNIPCTIRHDLEFFDSSKHLPISLLELYTGCQILLLISLVIV